MSNNNTPKPKVQVTKIDRIYLNPYDIVSLTRMGSRHAEVTYMARAAKPGIVKLNKDQYMILRTGEVREYDNSSDEKTIKNLRKVFRTLENTIKTNFDTVANAKNALFITLSYKENMQDEKRLYSDFNKFIIALKRAYKDHKFEYIVVAEPQERGAWHMHLMLKSNQKHLFIPHEELDRLWGRHKNGKGSAHVERLKSDDVGKYYASYFTSLQADAKDSARDEEDPDAVYVTDESGKRYKKGARLHFYPKHFKFYRCSRGIIRPTAEDTTYSEATTTYGEPQKVNTLSLSITPENAPDSTQPKHINTIQTEVFKKSENFENVSLSELPKNPKS